MINEGPRPVGAILPALPVMGTIVFFDTETCLIGPGLQAPPMVCLSYVLRVGMHIRPDSAPTLLHWTEAGNFIGDMLSSCGYSFVGANVAYDMLVVAAQFPLLLPGIFRAYEQDSVMDVQSRQKLIDIASGRFRGYLNSEFKWVPINYSLADLALRHTARPPLDKDTWRLRYSELRNMPVAAWPEGARDYAITDAAVTKEIWDNQEKQGVGVLADQFRQTRGDWFLKLGSAWGIRTDKAAVDKLERETKEEYSALQKELISYGLVRPNGERDTKAAKKAMLSACGWIVDATATNGYAKVRDDAINLVLTEGGDVSLASDTCRDTGDPVLVKYGEYGTLKMVLSKDITALRSGDIFPIHTRYDMAASGRSTSSGPNIQNWRRS